MPRSPGSRGGHSPSPAAVLIDRTMGRNRKNQAGYSFTDRSSPLLGRLRQEDYRLKTVLADSEIETRMSNFGPCLKIQGKKRRAEGWISSSDCPEGPRSVPSTYVRGLQLPITRAPENITPSLYLLPYILSPSDTLHIHFPSEKDRASRDINQT